MKRTLVLTTLVAVFVGFSAACATSMDHAPVGVAERVELSPEGAEFNNLFRDGRMYFAGQPTEAGFQEMAEAGVTTVINLRSDTEMTERVTFDER